MKIEENFNLRKYNTFNINCCCKYFVESKSTEELLDFVASYELKPEEILLLGGGSNFLFTEDFDGTVIYPTMQGIEVVEEDEQNVYVKVGAGVVWDDFVKWAVEKQLGGIENLSLIPGHVGAAPVQNMGAYGMEVADTIHRVEALDIEKAVPVSIVPEQCCFAYRDSIFKHAWKNRYIITGVVFALKKQPELKLEYGSIKKELESLGGGINVGSIRQAVINIRNSKLPDVKSLPNAGSFFKNPVVPRVLAEQLKRKYTEMPVYEVNEEYVKLAAGWLIEAAGWKGKRIGQAGIYELQALIVINYGNATGIEILRLINEVKKGVFMKFGIWLEPEVNII